MIEPVNQSSRHVQLSLLQFAPDHSQSDVVALPTILAKRDGPDARRIAQTNGNFAHVSPNTEALQLPGNAEKINFDTVLTGLELCGNLLQGSERQRFACAATQAALQSYWAALTQTLGLNWLVLPYIAEDLPALGDDTAKFLARQAGLIMAQADPITAGYGIGQIYTRLLPTAYRARFGVYFTPPALTARLLSLAGEAGVDWCTCRVLDPACGGGAFLAPVALTVARMLVDQSPGAILTHISTHLHGYEVDPFGAWMSQVLVEAALLPLCARANQRLAQLVTVCDSLAILIDEGRFDLVIGNPPYGRVTLPPTQRERFARSVYGHANLYGLFMDLAVRLTHPGGCIAFVTPTSFLGGEYFKALRKLMAEEAPPVAIDFVASRKDIFADVLQETLLATYARSAPQRAARVHVVAGDTTTVVAEPAGTFMLPTNPSTPWLIPRRSEQIELLKNIQKLPHRLRDYGYKVSTGPLVWNRHKDQLRSQAEHGAIPIVWAESVTPDGKFIYRTEKKNHQPFLLPRLGDEWLLARQGCVLVQRTTAKEQRRRLVAAEMPTSFVTQLDAVTVENHLNMVRPIVAAPVVPLCVVAALLNSTAVDDIFRCINGSVAVSAAELEAIPLPQPTDLVRLGRLLQDAALTWTDFDEEINRIYFRTTADATA